MVNKTGRACWVGLLFSTLLFKLKGSSLWSRLILHFWALETDLDMERMRPPGHGYEPDPVECLQRAYEQTIKATSEPNTWQGTTTATGAQLYYKNADSGPDAPVVPLLYVTNLGDSQVLVLRPRDTELVYKTKEQWHWFDCPRQLGTNSPDTPRANAVVDKVVIEENDVVLAMSDGVIDNLWEHEIIENVVTSIRKWESGEGGPSTGDRRGGAGGGMNFVADELMKAAKVIATDPFAESPFMEHAVEEGLAMEGGQFFSFVILLFETDARACSNEFTGKLDDISVVAGLCRKSGG
jgi:protein phosphatase PTC7